MNAIRHVAYRPALMLVLSAVALACSALTGCGSTASAGTGGGAGGSLCASNGRVDRLVVQRADLLPQNHPQFTFPAKIAVTDPGQARSVAQAACALPPMPSGTFSCPADMGIVYRLTFSAGGKELPPVQADAGGCGMVHGIGQTRWTISFPGFWQILAAAMGIRQPINSTFSGTTS
jgi:hypothetical protein